MGQCAASGEKYNFILWNRLDTLSHKHTDHDSNLQLDIINTLIPRAPVIESCLSLFLSKLRIMHSRKPGF